MTQTDNKTALAAKAVRVVYHCVSDNGSTFDVEMVVTGCARINENEPRVISMFDRVKQLHPGKYYLRYCGPAKDDDIERFKIENAL